MKSDASEFMGRSFRHHIEECREWFPASEEIPARPMPSEELPVLNFGQRVFRSVGYHEDDLSGSNN